MYRRRLTTYLKTKKYHYITTILLVAIVYMCYPYWHHLTAANNAQPHEESHPVDNVNEDSTVYKQPTCSPVKNILYVRQPKTGSGTLVNLFYRYMINHYGHSVNDGVDGGTEVNSTGAPASLSHHFIGDQFTVDDEDQDFQNPDAIRISSLRYPADQLVSTFSEWGIEEGLFSDKGMDEFKENFVKYSNGYPWYSDSPYARFFGLPQEKLRDHDSIVDLLKRVDERFHFVAIREFSHHSLVIMRRTLCWEMSDILYISLNLGTFKRVTLPWQIQGEHALRAPADYMLYQHFSAKLLHTIADEPFFVQETQTLTALTKKVWPFCDRIFARLKQNPSALAAIADEQGLGLDPRPFSEPFRLNGVQCVLMRLNSDVLRNLLLVKQEPEVCLQEELPYKVCEEPHPVHGVPLSTLALALQKGLI